MVAFVFAGLVATAVLGFEVATTVRFLDKSVRARGVVVEDRAHPWVAFTASGGQHVRFQQNGHLSAPAGTPVIVAYQANDPQGTARVHSFWADWGDVFDILPPAGLFIVASVLSLAGLLRR